MKTIFDLDVPVQYVKVATNVWHFAELLQYMVV